jgi:uncharacterized RDD family membrane protein YckC
MFDTTFPNPEFPVEQPSVTQGITFGPRAFAYGIDLAILYGMNQAMNSLLNLLLPSLFHLIRLVFHVSLHFGPSQPYSQYINGFILTLFYLALFEWILGASPGKMILGLRVVQQDGSPCRLGPALQRGFARLIDGMFMAIPAYLSMRPPFYQRLGDKAGKTMVVRRNDVVQPRNLFSWRLLPLIVIYPMIFASVMLGSLAFRMTQPEHLIISDANRINLVKGDLGIPASLKGEAGKEAFTNKTYWDANQRSFTSPSLFIQSRVILLNADPGDTDSQAISSLETGLRLQYKDSQLVIEKAELAQVGSRGWSMKFTAKNSDSQGFGLLFIRQNVLVRLIVDDTSGTLRLSDVLRLANIIDTRIRTGDYPPLLKSPST